MKKFSELTKRERLLVTLAIVIGVVYVTVFLLFIPALEQLSDSSQKHDDLVFQQQEMQLAVSSEPLTQNGNAKARAELEENKAFFSESMTDYEIDQYITELCKSCGLTPSVLAIQEVVEVGRPEQDESVAGDVTQEVPTETLMEAKGQTAGQPVPEESAPPQVSPLVKATVMVESTGNMSNLEQLLDKVSATNYLLTATVKYSDDSQTINVVFDLYMNNPALAAAD